MTEEQRRSLRELFAAFAPNFPEHHNGSRAPQAPSCSAEVQFKNTLFPDGCTLADLVRKCAKDAKNHGQFVSCVAQLAQKMRKSEVLAQKEAASLKRCAAQAK